MKSLARIHQFVSKNLALELYRSLIIPHIDYGNIIYDAIGTVDNYKLQTIQNKCLRICIKANPRMPIADLRAECKLPMVDVRRKLHVCNFVQKGLHNKSSNNVNVLFQPVRDDHNVATCSSTDNKINVPVTRLETCEQNIKIRGAKYYNRCLKCTD